MTAEADLVVVGAGPWGLTCAWRCALEGARVCVVDDGRPAAGWAAAGMLGVWSEAEEGREALNSILRRSVEAWPRFADGLARAAGVDCAYLRSGTVFAAHRPEHIGAVRHRLAAMAGGGSRRWVSGPDLRGIEPGLSPRVAGGTDLFDEHQVDPRRLLDALRGAVHASGVEIVRGTATAVRRHAVALASGGRLRAGRVVLAAGWAASRLSDRVALRPVKGQILRLGAPEGQELPIRRVVRTPSVYLVPRAAGELVVGATSEEAGDLRVGAGAVHRLLDEAIHVVPGVRDMEWREASAGLRPATTDGLSALGEDADGVIWAAGGYRHGILMSPSVAEALAQVVAGGDLPEWARPFSPIRFRVGQPEVPCASR